MNDWLNLFGYSWKDIVGTEYSSATLYTPSSVDCPTAASGNDVGHFGVISGLRCLTENVQNSFSVLGFVPAPKLRSSSESRRNTLPGISYRIAALGEGLLLSRIDKRASVKVVDGPSTNGVLQGVLSTVLDGSYWLDMQTIQGGQDVFYFVKETSVKLKDNQEDLKRLSGQFNITLIDSERSGAGSELRVVNNDLAVSIFYGMPMEQAKHRILRTSHRRAVDLAWLHEKQLVESGLPGQVEWGVEEKVQLLTNGRVDGFVGSDLHSIYDYPQLADDPSNIVFRRDTKRKRRKSHRSRQRS